MKPWDRRLYDLSKLLENCHTTYLDPDLFRRNTNQFLQTARTITFIIQKNKAAIPEYEDWYAHAVLGPWKADEIMQWAKEARNTIEKEGDLETHSSLHVALIFSYLSEHDKRIDCGREELLRASVKKLVRLAQKALPTGVLDAAVIKIERRWVTETLPSWELLHALSYVYARMFDCCKSLAKHCGECMDSSISEPSEFDSSRDASRKVSFVKLNGLNSHSIRAETVAIDKGMEVPPAIKATLGDLNEPHRAQIDSLRDAVAYYQRMAEATFLHFGHHVFMLFILGDKYQPIDMLSTQFSDQADKFIFWRSIAERVVSLRATGIVWIGESWIREADRSSNVAVRNLPIKGERLSVLGIDRFGNHAERSWKIIRRAQTEKPTLEGIEASADFNGDGQFFLVPVMRAFGLPDPPYVPQRNAG